MDTLASMNMQSARDIRQAQSGLPVSNTDAIVNPLNQANLTLTNMYGFMRTQETNFYKSVNMKLDVNNRLMGELLNVTSKAWGVQTKFNPSKLIKDSNTALARSIEKSNKAYIAAVAKDNQEVLDYLKKISKAQQDEARDTTSSGGSKGRESLGNYLKGQLGDLLTKGVNVAKVYIGDQLSRSMKYGTDTFTGEVGKITSATQKLTNNLSALSRTVASITAQMVSNYDPSIYQSGAYNKVLSKYGTAGMERADALYSSLNTGTTAMQRRFGIPASQARQLASNQLTKSVQPDYYYYNRSQEELFKLQQAAQRQAYRENVTAPRDFAFTRKQARERERYQWRQEANAAAHTSLRGSAIAPGSDLLYNLERIMPGLSAETTKLFKVAIADSASSAKGIYDEIARTTRNLKVDASTLQTIAEEQTLAMKQLTGKDTDLFNKNMRSLVKTTGLLEDAFIDATEAFSAVDDLAWTSITEMSDSQLTKLAMQASQAGMSVTSYQKYLQTNPDAVMTMLGANRGLAARYGVSTSGAASTRDLVLMDLLFGATGKKGVTQFRQQVTADFTAGESAYKADQGVDIGIYKYNQSLQQEIFTEEQSRALQRYNYVTGLIDKEFERKLEGDLNKYTDMLDRTYMTDLEKVLLERDKELLASQELYEWYNKLQLSSYGLQNLGGAAGAQTTTATTIGSGAIDLVAALLTGFLGGKISSKSISALLSKFTGAGAGEAAAAGGAAEGAAGASLGLGGLAQFAGGAAAASYGLYKGVGYGSTLLDRTSSDVSRGSATAGLVGAGLTVGGGATAMLAAGSIGGPIGLGIAALGVGAMAAADRFKEMNDASAQLRPVLDEYRKQFEIDIQKNKEEYTQLNDKMSNYQTQVETTRQQLQDQGLTTDEVNNKLQSMGLRISDDTMKQLSDLNQQLHNGTLDQEDYNKAVVALANKDQSSGALDILANNLNNPETGTVKGTGDMNEALRQLASGNESYLSQYTSALVGLTDATTSAADAAWDFAKKAAQKERDLQVKEAGTHLAESMSTSFQEAISSGDWNRAQSIIDDMKTMGISKESISKYQNDSDRGSGNDYDGLTSKEVYNLIKGGWGKETTAERISNKGTLAQTNEMIQKYNVRGGAGNNLLTISTDEELAKKSESVAALSNYFQGEGASTINGWSAANDAEKSKYRSNVEAAKRLGSAFNTFSSFGVNRNARLEALVDAGILTEETARYYSSATYGSNTYDFSTPLGVHFGKIKGYAVGSAYIPSNQLAVVHQGERIIPAEANADLGQNMEEQVNLTTLSNELDTQNNAWTFDMDELFNKFMKVEIVQVHSELIALDKDLLVISTKISNAVNAINSEISSRSINLVDAQRTSVRDLQDKFKPFFDLVDYALKQNPIPHEGGGDPASSALNSIIQNPYSQYPVTSAFQRNRKNPVTGKIRNHTGTDYGIPEGTDIKAFDNGKVILSQYDGGYGNSLVMETANGIRYRFAHMQGLPYLSVGDSVSVGQVLGKVGSTGNSTGPHLHLEVIGADGAYINPQDYFAGGHTVSGANPFNSLLALLGLGKSFGIDSDTGVLTGTHTYSRYDLSNAQLEEVARVITGETGGLDRVAAEQEASQMANLNEIQRGKAATAANLISTLHSGWYAKSSWTRGVTDVARQAARVVFIEGRGALPRYVVEHDTFPMDIIGAKDRGSYSLGDAVRNKYGSNYKFYTFFGSNKSGDIAGYTDYTYNKVAGSHETGLSRVPYDDYPALLHKNERVLTANESLMWQRMLSERIESPKDYTIIVSAIDVLTSVVRDIYSQIKKPTSRIVETSMSSKSNSIDSYV